MKKIYITTPIYYSSGKPHLGHAYTTILADVISKYKRAIGYDVFFTTGMDEHGQKIFDVAKKMKKDTMQMLNDNAKNFQKLWKELDINYDFFVRTTKPEHKKTVQKIFSYLCKKKFIYKGVWTSYYCPSCEENYTKTQAIKKNGKLFCKLGHELVFKNEPSFFLKTSKYQKWIRKYFQTHHNFIYPNFRAKELINNFLNEGLKDLSISRKTLHWGIPIKEDKDHVIYVWFDALFNYLTNLGYKTKKYQNFTKYWKDEKSEIVHFMSKEISRFHCIYWPIMLKMLNLRLPNKVIVHGWIINNNEKMSKSKGNVIDPWQYISNFGSDSLRYFLMKESNLENDFNFTDKLFCDVYNHDLANNYGNVLTRIVGMIKKYCNGIVPPLTKKDLDHNDQKIIASRKEILKKYKNLINSYKIKELLTKIQENYLLINKYIDETKPWILFKNKKINKLFNFLNIIFNFNCDLIILLRPILQQTTKKIEQILGLKLNFKSLNNDHAKLKISSCPPIFNRK